MMKTTNGSGTFGKKTFTHWRRKSVLLSQSASSLPVYREGKVAQGKKWRKAAGASVTAGHGRRVLSVRELAIQPTQRVMRYVLQYRGA